MWGSLFGLTQGERYVHIFLEYLTPQWRNFMEMTWCDMLLKEWQRKMKLMLNSHRCYTNLFCTCIKMCIYITFSGLDKWYFVHIFSFSKDHKLKEKCEFLCCYGVHHRDTSWQHSTTWHGDNSVHRSQKQLWGGFLPWQQQEMQRYESLFQCSLIPHRCLPKVIHKYRYWWNTRISLVLKTDIFTVHRYLHTWKIKMISSLCAQFLKTVSSDRK